MKSVRLKCWQDIVQEDLPEDDDIDEDAITLAEEENDEMIEDKDLQQANRLL